MAVTNVQLGAPTSRLPPIADIAAFSTAQLTHSVQYLYALYRPQVRGSRRRRREAPKDAIAAVDDEDVRSDAFERAYAIRWLTALIARLEVRAGSPDLPTDAIDADALIQQAASLFATCAGVAAAGKVQRRFTFESALAGQIHVDLTDIPIDNHDYRSVGAQTWGGACVLAEMIAERPERFGLLDARGPGSLHDTYSPRPLRILELGAGTGLVGLTVAKLLQALPLCKNSPTHPPFRTRASIVLTDYYPAALANLASNLVTNFPPHPDADADVTATDRTTSVVRITAHPLDWSSFSATVIPTPDPTPDVLSPPFDVVFGADIVYEAQHAAWIRDCLASLLARPPDGSNEDPGAFSPAFHLVIPLRPTHTFESSTVEAVFGFKDRIPVSERSKPELTILSKESIICEAYGDGIVERARKDDDVEYVYYQIGWT